MSELTSSWRRIKDRQCLGRRVGMIAPSALAAIVENLAFTHPYAGGESRGGRQKKGLEHSAVPEPRSLVVAFGEPIVAKGRNRSRALQSNRLSCDEHLDVD